MTPSNHVMPPTEVHPDDETLRRARRNRVLAEMEEADIDVLVVGREGNARYVTGAPRLWMAGSRPFGPGCVLVRATGAVHMLSTWDEGIPDDIPHENLYGISFNAGNLIKSLQKIEGADSARTVATDSMSPSSARLLPTAFPASRLVDGEPLLRRARRVKSPEEIEAIRTSVGIAERSLAPAVAALGPGITERELTGIFMEAMASAGVTTPATQDVAWITSRVDPWRRTSRDTPVSSGDLVAFEAGVILDGYVGELGRTHLAGGNEIDEALYGRQNELWDRLLEACRVGSPVSDLLDVYSEAGVPAPPMPVARGLGLGFDLPLVTAELPATAGEQQIEVGMVLALTAFIWQEGVGAVYGQEPVVVTSNGPELLTAAPFREARSATT
jgi:Xaa-Pro dipeptidase